MGGGAGKRGCGNLLRMGGGDGVRTLRLGAGDAYDAYDADREELHESRWEGGPRTGAGTHDAGAGLCVPRRRREHVVF
jgi:hypothetical protein